MEHPVNSTHRTLPAPVIFIFALLLGIGFNSVWRLPAGWHPRRAFLSAGIALVVAAATIMPPVLIRFRQARTPFDPRKTASTLVTDGPYRYTRHPSYVALTLLYLGLCLIIDNGWAMAMAVPAFIALDRIVVGREEEKMIRAFGEKYRRYQCKVRRWI